jgi:hypothetical protein
MRGTFVVARNKPQTQGVTGIARSQSWQAKSATETGLAPGAAFDFGKIPIYPPAPTPVATTHGGYATGSGPSSSPGELVATGGPTPGQIGDMPPPVKIPAPEPPVIEDPAPSEPIPATRVGVDTITANIGPKGPNIAHVPPCGAQPAITLTAHPKAAKPVTWSIDPASPAGVAAGTALTPDATTLTATLALGAGQKGGELDIHAENSENGTMLPYLLASHPTGINSTSARGDPADPLLYGGVFNHEFTSNDGRVSSLDQVTVGERFPKLPTPDAHTHTFMSDFNPATKLKTGTTPDTPGPGSGVWLLTSNGELGGDGDTVSGPKKDIDIGRHLASGSNPTPAHPMPVKMELDQQFFWWCPHAPLGHRWEHAADTTQTHILRLDKAGTGAEYVAIVNKQENVMPYDGDPSVVKTGVTRARADTPTVAPSPAGGPPNTVQITADVFPSGRPLFFSITGNAHGCTINHATGELTIGNAVGTVKVRAANVNGGSNWDEVTVTIAAAPAAPPAPAPAPPGSQPLAATPVPHGARMSASADDD